MITPFIGEIVLYAFDFAPQAGKWMPLSQNTHLHENTVTQYQGKYA